MPGGSGTEELTQRRELASRREAPDVRDMHSDEIDQAIPDERHVFGLVDIQLAHRQWDARLRSEHPEVVPARGCEYVLQKEQVVGLEVLCELDSHDWRDPLVNVVQQLDAFPELASEVFEHSRNQPAVGPRLPRILVRVETCPGSVRTTRLRDVHTASAIRRVAGDLDLTADVTETLFHVPTDLVLEFRQVAPGRVHIDTSRTAALAAEQLVHGHAGPLALDVPERLVHAGDGVVQNWSAPPVGADHSCLPDIFDVVGVPTEQEWLEVLLDGGDDGKRPLREGGAAEAPKASVARLDLDDHQADAVGCRADRLDVRDLDRRHVDDRRRRRRLRRGLDPVLLNHV